jgi:hypothetical protein
MVGVLISRIARFLTWEYWGKCHLDVTLMTCHKKYYKKEGGGFPQIQVVMNLMNSCMPMVNLCTKNVQTIN